MALQSDQVLEYVENPRHTNIYYVNPDTSESTATENHDMDNSQSADKEEVVASQ